MVNPIIAAVLSFIIPGVGQIVDGKTKRGLIFLAAEIIMYVLLFTVGSIAIILSLILSIYSAYDAYQLAST
jgi:TM2 domain-containing membrane protein YozV